MNPMFLTLHHRPRVARRRRSLDAVRRPAGYVAVMATMTLAGATLKAQQEPERTSRAHVGPFYIQPVIALRDIGVDSNVYNVENPISDFTFTVIPSFAGTAGTPRARFTFNSATEFVYFAQQDSERSVNQALDGAGRFRLRRVSVFADGGYLNTRQRPNEEIDARSRRIAYRGGAGVGVALWPKLVAELTGQYVRTTYDADAFFDHTLLAEELNRATRTVGANARYTATPLTTVVATAELERTTFTEASIRDSDSRRVLVGLDLNPRALIAGSVRVGLQRFRPLSPALANFDGLVGSANVNYRLRTSTTFGFTFDRNIAYSYLELEPYYLREGFAVSVNRQLVERWDLEANGGRFWHRYQLVEAVAPAGMITEENFVLGGLAIGYRARPGTRLRAGVSYEERRSPQNRRHYHSVRLGTSVIYGF